MRITTLTTLTRLSLATAVVAAASSATAAVTTIDFENIPQGAQGTPAECRAVLGAPILGYYNGDQACGPRAGAQDLNVSFAAGALAITTNTAGGFGQFSSAHSGVSAAGTVADTAVTVLPGGLLLSEFAFWYNAIAGSDPVVQLFSGNQSVFEQQLTLCTTPGADGFCGWTLLTAPLSSSGTPIDRIVFSAEPNGVVFDDMRFTTPAVAPVPEPSSITLALAALAGVAGLSRRRNKR